MAEKNKNIVTLYCLAIMFTAWCTWNSVNNGSLLAKVADYRVEIHQFQRQVASLTDRLDSFEQRDIKDEVELPDALSRINE